MKKISLTIGIALLLTSPSLAAGLLKPKGDDAPALQIKEHIVKVVINNGFAVTEVDQIFHNPHDRDFDAIYSFPLPKEASLSELSLWIDGREAIGEVIEKEEARKAYQEERDAGNDTALAEKREYYSFDVFVSPVRAGSDTRVRLVYMQPLEIDSGVGRYVYPLEDGEIDEEIRAFWDRMPSVQGRFSFQCLIRTAYPLEEVRAKGYDHLSRVTQSAEDTWIVNIDSEEGSSSLDQDIVVYYRLAQDLRARVDLLTHRVGDGPGTFLMVITPGADLKPIEEGVDWSVVLDISGSMQGKLVAAVDALARAIDQMRQEDRFQIVVFSDRAQYLMEGWTPVSPGSIDEARKKLESLQTQGGTNVHEGLELGLKHIEEDRTSAIILVSDGGANVGPTHHNAFLDLLEDKDVRVFTFVMGQGANQPLMRTLAKESGGFSMDVSNRDDLYGRILQAKEKLGREAMHGVRIELDGARAVELAPQQLRTAYWGDQITVFGRYLQPGKATLRLRTLISGEEKRWETRVQFPEEAGEYPELERLWALARVDDIMDQIHRGGDEDDLRQAVVDIGTEYSIVTDYTSMIVMSEEEFERRGIERKNRLRVDEERLARETRMQQVVKSPRADTGKPMFQNRPSHGLGGGAVGPGFFGLLAALLGARGVMRKRSGK